MRYVRRSAAFAAVFACSGCALVHQLDDFTVASSSGGDVAPATAIAPNAAGGEDAGAECRVTSDCTSAASGPAFATLERAETTARVCVRGRCQALLTEECSRVHGDALADDAVFFGGIFGGANDDEERGALLAIDELASAALPAGTSRGTAVARGASERPIALVACNGTDRGLRAAEHLVGALHVPALVGPASAEAVIELTQQVTVAGGALLVTSSLASPITSLADSDLTWRSVPSDTQRAKLVIDQVNALESVLRATRATSSVRFAVVRPGDALGTSMLDSIRGKLIVNGRFLTDPSNAANVSDDTYAPGDTSAMAAVATRYASAFRPDVIFVTAPEQIANVVVPLERALTAARVVDKPFYVFAESCRTSALLDAIATALPADFRRRLRGVGVQAEAPSQPVLQAFRTTWATRFGGTPSARAAAAYDTTYALAFARAATRGEALSGASLGRGLRKLGVGDPVAIGPSSARAALETLGAGGSVSPRGTTARLTWDTAGDVASGTLEVWCVGTANGAPSFGGAGVSMDVSTQVVGGAFTQCQ